MAELRLGNIKPVSTDNVVVESQYVKGGYITVETLAERDRLKTADGENIVKGSLCYCQEDEKFYQYNGSTWEIKLNLDDKASKKTTDENEKNKYFSKSNEIVYLLPIALSLDTTNSKDFS